MFTNAKYIKDSITGLMVSVKVEIDGNTSFVPIDTMNGDYNEIMRLVASGELVISAASEAP
jgi:hypothetical protein